MDTAALFPYAGTSSARRKRLPFLDVLGFTMRDYLRSPWPILSLLLMVGIHALFYNYKSDQGHLFSVEYGAALLTGAITAGVFFSRANRPETQAILARPVGRASFAFALLLNSWIVTLVLHALSVIAEAIRYSEWLDPQGPIMNWRYDPLVYLEGSLPIVAGAAFAVGLIAFLSGFVSSPGLRLGTLTVLAVLVMSFDSRNFPIVALRPFLQQMPPVLAPIAGAVRYATQPVPDTVATYSLVIVASYALALWLGVMLLSSGRDVTHE